MTPPKSVLTSEELREAFAKKFKNIHDVKSWGGQECRICRSKDDASGRNRCQEEIVDFIRSRLTAERLAIVEEMKVTENTSDGYHTFKELYEFRKVFNAVLFNEWASQGKYSVHKSIRHGDGELAFGGGWFIVMATLPTGQISNHYEMKDFELFQCEEREKADEWDGHTAQDVLASLESLKSELVNEKKP